MADMTKTVERVETLIRFMWLHQHPGKKIEINRTMLELDIMKWCCIKMAIDEMPYDEGGVE